MSAAEREERSRVGEPASTAARTYVALGDSFSAGSEPGVAPFPDQLAARLRDWRHVNLAVAGARAADVVAGQLDAALEAEPDLVTLVCGANDVVRTTRPDVAGFATSLNLILARLRADAPDALVVTATYPAVSDEHSALRPRTRARIVRGLQSVNDVVRRLSAHHGATCIELTDHPSRHERGSYAADGFHPSAAGHRHAAEAVAACLREAPGIAPDLDTDPDRQEALT